MTTLIIQDGDKPMAALYVMEGKSHPVRNSAFT
jgi:hypothetical protein